MLPGTKDEAIAIAATVPMALRGRAEVTSYAPSALPQPSDDLLARVSQLYAADPQLHPLWSAALEARGLAEESAARQDPASLGKLAAGFLVKPNGPRIAMLETGGWDTHSGQAGRLAAQLKALDTLLAALRYESRDLRPTMALDALIAGAAGRALALDPQEVGRRVFATKAVALG